MSPIILHCCSQPLLKFVLEKFVVFTSLLLLYTSVACSQSTVVSGRVIDANSGDPIPFANLIFQGQSTGTTTDFEGFYEMQINLPVDSIICSYIGYKSRTKAIFTGKSQVIDFQLEEDIISLQEVVFIAGENPAIEILRNVVEQMAGDDGKPILPVFISESLSESYYRNNPKLQHERIIKSKISGVGVDDGSLVSQFIGSSFQEYNFYNNWLNIVSKDFVSPIADGWNLFYEYDLTDSSVINNDLCYRLDFFPKREQDLAFYGTMWITKDEYALKQIDATIAKSANLNYIEKIKIQQELVKTEAGAWIPSKNRILLDIGEITKNMAGVLAKFYTSNQNIEINQVKDLKFYQQPIVLAEDYQMNNGDDYWLDKRHEPLSPTEMSVYTMIDSLKNIPIVKTYTELINIAVNGYKKVGKIDFGPYITLYANNSIEGNRFQGGFRTNEDFSNKWIFGARVAYGTRDEEFKYGGFVERIVDRNRWTTVKTEYTRDIDQVGLAAEDLLGNSVFLTATKFGDLVRPYLFDQFKFTAQREIFKGYNQKVIFNYRTFDPLYPFAYKTDPEQPDSPVESQIQTAEVTIESRFAKDELFIQNENTRVSLGTNKWPIFTVKYTRGIAGIVGSDFSYNRLGLNIRKNLKLGLLGTSDFNISAEHIFENLGTANILYGYLDPANNNLLADLDENGNIVEPIGRLTDDPYIELGYGIENIFKVIRIDFLHRLTYLDNPNVSNFGVKVSFQIIL